MIGRKARVSLTRYIKFDPRGFFIKMKARFFVITFLVGAFASKYGRVKHLRDVSDTAESLYRLPEPNGCNSDHDSRLIQTLHSGQLAALDADWVSSNACFTAILLNWKDFPSLKRVKWDFLPEQEERFRFLQMLRISRLPELEFSLADSHTWTREEVDQHFGNQVLMSRIATRSYFKKLILAQNDFRNADLEELLEPVISSESRITSLEFLGTAEENMPWEQIFGVPSNIETLTLFSVRRPTFDLVKTAIETGSRSLKKLDILHAVSPDVFNVLCIPTLAEITIHYESAHERPFYDGLKSCGHLALKSILKKVHLTVDEKFDFATLLASFPSQFSNLAELIIEAPGPQNHLQSIAQAARDKFPRLKITVATPQDSRVRIDLSSRFLPYDDGGREGFGLNLKRIKT